MRPILVPLFLAAALPAQVDFVKNGDFSLVDASNMPQLWTVTQQTFHNARVEDHTFNGVPIFTKAFRCQPGGSAAFTRPYPLCTLDQVVTVPAGVPLELSADICHSRAAAVTNADRGTVKAYLGTTLLDTRPPTQSSLVGPDYLMERLCARTILAQGGPLTLSLTFYRDYHSTDVVVHLDNVKLTICPGPAFTFRGDRKLGKAMTYEVQGDTGAGYFIFLGVGPSPVPGGISIPGAAGTFQLSPVLVLPAWSGTLVPPGLATASPGVFPNDPALRQIPIWFQGLQAAVGPALAFGNAHGFKFF